MPGPMPVPAWIVGIDVGGTKTALGVAAFPEGRLLCREAMDTPAGPAAGASFLDELCRRAAGLLEWAAAQGTPVRAIGLSLCELVGRDGAVESAQRVSWRGLPVRARLAALAPAAVEADVRAAALAEARFGAGRGDGQILYLNVGTGISACWVKDGVPHAGARGHALAIASSLLSFACPHCGESSSYILEEIAGGPGLAAAYAARGGSPAASAREVIEAAARGDPAARAVVARATDALGLSVGLLVNALDPDALIVGGGLGAADGPYWDGLVDSVRRHVWSDATRTLPIRRAALGGDSALLGAAAAAWLAAGEG
ncbi:MAG: ROK family protein [Dongiaceae bacterium]